jgi:hypothetical protein
LEAWEIGRQLLEIWAVCNVLSLCSINEKKQVTAQASLELVKIMPLAVDGSLIPVIVTC